VKVYDIKPRSARKSIVCVYHYYPDDGYGSCGPYCVALESVWNKDIPAIEKEAERRGILRLADVRD
jgi:hypothetical protein